MDTNRFRKRTNYTAPSRSRPVLDKLGQLRQAPGPSQPSEPSQPTTPAAVPTAMATAAQEHAFRPAVVPTAPKPVYEQVLARDEGLIDLSEPVHGGWLDAIAPEPAYEPSGELPMPMTSEAAAEAVQALPLSELPANISIQISLPKLHKPSLPALPYKRILRWTIVVTGVLAVATGGLLVFKHFHHTVPQEALTAGGYHALAAAALTKPSFTPVVPDSKPDLAALGSQNTAFDGIRDSYSYRDALGGVPLVVSEQPLPSKFSTVTKAVAAAAQSVGAKQQIITKNTLAYMATDTKSSTQTIVFSLKGLLLFAQSNFPHSSGDWKNYIDSLQ